MEALFAQYLQAGIFGSVIIVMVLLLRCCLRKAPRRILCLLWLVAAIRLLLPFQLESRLSLQPDLEEAAVAVQQLQDSRNPAQDQPAEAAPAEPQEIPPFGVTENPATEEPGNLQLIISVIWLAGAGAAIGYLVISYGVLRFRIREAVLCEDGVLECDRIPGAFLLGYLRPRIYLPFRVDQRDREFIIAHERAHIARGDNWWKLLGFVCAAIHWYNPLVWLSYALLCRDIELACDERVIRQLTLADRKAYSVALLNCGKRMAGFSVCPVAFGEVSLKTRIKSILRYRKPGMWITAIAMALIAVTAVCFLTSPIADAAPQEELPAVTEPTADSVTEPSEPVAELPAEPETLPQETEHVHTYAVLTVAPTCMEGGYELYTCSCGDAYQRNLTELGEHNWVYNSKFFYHKYAAEQPFVCTVCGKEIWTYENVNIYPDLGYADIRDAVLAYASSLGFRTAASGDVEDTLSYSCYVTVDRLRSMPNYDWDEYYTDKGFELVDKAYSYCIANNLAVSEQTVYFVNEHRNIDLFEDHLWSNYENRLYAVVYFTHNGS